MAGKVLFLVIVMVTMVFTLKLLKQFINVYINPFVRVSAFYLTIKKCKD